MHRYHDTNSVAFSLFRIYSLTAQSFLPVELNSAFVSAGWGRNNHKTSLFSAGVRDLHRHTRPQEHHSVQPVCEAGPERSSSVVGDRLHRRVRHDVAHRHRHRHQRDGGSARIRGADPGHPGGARRGDVRLHHLSRDPPAWAELAREAAAQGALHPAGLQRHGGADVSGLRLTAAVVSAGVSVRVGPECAKRCGSTGVWVTYVHEDTLSSLEKKK